jgi:hypothetical protein
MEGYVFIRDWTIFLSPAPPKCYLACFKPKWRHVNGERGDLINLKDGK